LFVALFIRQINYHRRHRSEAEKFYSISVRPRFFEPSKKDWNYSDEAARGEQGLYYH